METKSEQIGQIEFGTITHQGKEFTCGGSSVVGDSVTGYLKMVRHSYHSRFALTRWNGSTMLECRAKVVETYHMCDGITDESYAIVFGLTHGRAIVGYALGDGMLFRGTLIECEPGEVWTDREIEIQAKRESEYWMDRDQEDAENYDEEGND